MQALKVEHYKDHLLLAFSINRFLKSPPFNRILNTFVEREFTAASTILTDCNKISMNERFECKNTFGRRDKEGSILPRN